MANPEQPLQSSVWINGELAALDQVANLGQTVSGGLSVVNTGLSLSLTILDTLKSFTVGYLDPLQTLLQAVIREVDQIVSDLDQIGLYATGDWTLLQLPYNELRGGYPAYERRMIARLTDKNDPTRPNFSEASAVGAVFLYGSTNAIGELEKLVRLIKRFTNFFRVTPANETALPIPTRLQAKYGSAALTIFEFDNLSSYFETNTSAPDKVNVSWNISATQPKDPIIPIPQPGPGGFLVEVSTLR
ncbi:MAG: hypothetical protein AAGM67_14825, partial [Bacteroidota bacterium]